VTLTSANGSVETLYVQVSQVDAEPTAAQLEATTAAERDVTDVMKRWQSLEANDLPALNRALTGANLPELKIEVNPHAEESGMNIDEE